MLEMIYLTSVQTKDFYDNFSYEDFDENRIESFLDHINNKDEALKDATNLTTAIDRSNSFLSSTNRIIFWFAIVLILAKLIFKNGSQGEKVLLILANSSILVSVFVEYSYGKSLQQQNVQIKLDCVEKESNDFFATQKQAVLNYKKDVENKIVLVDKELLILQKVIDDSKHLIDTADTGIKKAFDDLSLAITQGKNTKITSIDVDSFMGKYCELVNGVMKDFSRISKIINSYPNISYVDVEKSANVLYKCLQANYGVLNSFEAPSDPESLISRLNPQLASYIPNLGQKGALEFFTIDDKTSIDNRIMIQQLATDTSIDKSGTYISFLTNLFLRRSSDVQSIDCQASSLSRTLANVNTSLIYQIKMDQSSSSSGTRTTFSSKFPFKSASCVETYQRRQALDSSVNVMNPYTGMIVKTSDNSVISLFLTQNSFFDVSNQQDQSTIAYLETDIGGNLAPGSHMIFNTPNGTYYVQYKGSVISQICKIRFTSDLPHLINDSMSNSINEFAIIQIYQNMKIPNSNATSMQNKDYLNNSNEFVLTDTIVIPKFNMKLGSLKSNGYPVDLSGEMDNVEVFVIPGGLLGQAAFIEVRSAKEHIDEYRFISGFTEKAGSPKTIEYMSGWYEDRWGFTYQSYNTYQERYFDKQYSYAINDATRLSSNYMYSDFVLSFVNSYKPYFDTYYQYVPNVVANNFYYTFSSATIRNITLSPTSQIQAYIYHDKNFRSDGSASQFDFSVSPVGMLGFKRLPYFSSKPFSYLNNPKPSFGQYSNLIGVQSFVVIPAIQNRTASNTPNLSLFHAGGILKQVYRGSSGAFRNRIAPYFTSFLSLAECVNIGGCLVAEVDRYDCDQYNTDIRTLLSSEVC